MAIYSDLLDALSVHFLVGLDVKVKRGPAPAHDVIGPDAFRLTARRRDNDHVVGESKWMPEPESAARSLIAALLVLRDPDVRDAVGPLRL